MTAEYKNWQEDFVDINFTDQRLKSRFFKIIDAFAASPGKSTWAATGSRSSARRPYPKPWQKAITKTTKEPRTKQAIPPTETAM